MYKILDTCWHVMHQTRLAYALRDDAEFYFVHNSWRDWSDPRFLKARPIPPNIKFVPYFEPDKYDFAILHIDQQAVNPDINKGRIYRELNETITGLPKVVINHGSPIYPEYMQREGMTGDDAIDAIKSQIKALVGDNKMIVNSHDAVQAWGWGYPIVHGYKPEDYFDLPKEPRVFTALSPAGLDDYYNRACMNEVAIELNKTGRQLWWAKVNCLADGNFDDYRERLGSSLIYLDTSYKTPMNGARTEAFLSGCCVVQVEGAHDLDRWAVHNKNIVIVPNNPREITKTIVNLLENHYEEAIKIGQEGKKMAQKIFNWKRYREDWLKYIKEELLCK
jgi:glycosyltransferase involved in cell wall biosynthesis